MKKIVLGILMMAFCSAKAQVPPQNQLMCVNPSGQFVPITVPGTYSQASPGYKPQILATGVDSSGIPRIWACDANGNLIGMGGGGGTPAGNPNELQYNQAGAFGGATNYAFAGGTLGIKAGQTNAAALTFYSASYAIGTDTTDLVLTTNSPNGISLKAAGGTNGMGGTVILRALGNGNIGIAGMTAPQAPLSFGGSTYTPPIGAAYNSYKILLFDGGTSPTSYGLGVEAGNMGLNATGGYKFYQGGGAVPLMVVGSVGVKNVGIGTASPQSLLDVNGALVATGANNYNSGAVNLTGNYWTGAASAPDYWQLQTVLGAGANPTTTLNFNHTGSSGAANINFPAGVLNVAGNLNVTGVSFSNIYAVSVARPAGVPQIVSSTGALVLAGNSSGTGTVNFETTASTAPYSMIIDSSGRVAIGTNAATSPLQVVNLPVYANNAAAVSGGLTVGAFYRTGGDPDTIAVVH